MMDENIRYDRGSCEVEVSMHGEADLQQALIMCSKNPGHQDFIPTQQFSQDHLPLAYQDSLLVELVRVLSDLTVRVAVTYTSPDRPDFYPDTKIPYPFSDQKTSVRQRTGSGWVWSVEKFSQLYDDKTCPCQICVSDDNPHHKWAEVVIGSAAHVVYDNKEGQHTTCHLFYDSGRTPEVCSSVLVLRGIAKVDRNVKEDKCRLTYITHDLELADRLELLTTRFVDLQKQLSQRYNSESTPRNSKFSPSRSQSRSPSPIRASALKNSEINRANIASPSNIANTVSVHKKPQFRPALKDLNNITSFPIDPTSNQLSSKPFLANINRKVDPFLKKTMSSAKSVPDIVELFSSNAMSKTPFRHKLRTESPGESQLNLPSRSMKKANDSLSSLISFFNSMSGVSADEPNQFSRTTGIDRPHSRLGHRKDQSKLTPHASQMSRQSSCQKSQQMTDSQQNTIICCHYDHMIKMQTRNTSHNEPHKIRFLPSLSVRGCKSHHRTKECIDLNDTQKLSPNYTGQLSSHNENMKRSIPTRSRLISGHRTVVTDNSEDYSDGCNAVYQTPVPSPVASTPTIMSIRPSAASSGHRLTSSSARSLNHLRWEDETLDQPRQGPAQLLVRKPRSQSVPDLRETDPTLTIIVSHPHGCSKQVSVGHYVQRLAVKDSRNLTKYVYTTPTCPGSSGAPVYVLGRWRGWWPFDHPHNGNSEADRKLNFSGVGLH